MTLNILEYVLSALYFCSGVWAHFPGWWQCWLGFPSLPCSGSALAGEFQLPGFNSKGCKPFAVWLSWARKEEGSLRKIWSKEQVALIHREKGDILGPGKQHTPLSGAPPSTFYAWWWAQREGSPEKQNDVCIIDVILIYNYYRILY